MNILNLTQHPATREQLKHRVIDLPEKTWQALYPDSIFKSLKDCLTFVEPPVHDQIIERAKLLATVAETLNYKLAMIEGPNFLIPALEHSLNSRNIIPVYSFLNLNAKHLGFITSGVKYY